MFSKVLVANRGEIAVRIMRTCRELGIRTVAVYSEADRNALHVTAADESFLIGPSPALQSYLAVDSILRVALEAGVDAVHPGYGFLAENPTFAQAVVDAGLTWIGPTAHVIERLGDKMAAKLIAAEAGVPVVPGYAGEDLSTTRMQAEAARIGYPVMLKAAAGGGGKGMRVVRSPEELDAAHGAAQREARSAFGDDRVFIEKLLLNPRHIEMQVIADTHGNVIYLGERDCSIQRRHQKVVEEAPSPVMTTDLRCAMGESAVRLARACGYTNAGTVEFLYSADQFYFLEVNTRIQVEHPVTELVTGLDLVRLQLQVAAGDALSLAQADVESRGHAVEVRLYAEDAQRGFVPATGRVAVYSPPLGPGVRVDTGIQSGSEVSQFYDPLLAKLVVHAPTRDQAVHRLHDALARWVVVGLTTNLTFLTWISAHPDFSAGRVDTGWLDRTWQPGADSEVPDVALVAAAAIQATTPQLETGERVPTGGDEFSPWRHVHSWRVSGSTRTFQYLSGGSTVHVTLTTDHDGALSVTVRGSTQRVRLDQRGGGQYVLSDGVTSVSIAATPRVDCLLLQIDGRAYELVTPGRSSEANSAGTMAAESGLSAPMPGTVVKVLVCEGQHVDAHEPLVILEAMKMEHMIEAPHSGTVEALLVKEGDLVPAGTPIARMTRL